MTLNEYFHTPSNNLPRIVYRYRDLFVHHLNFPRK